VIECPSQRGEDLARQLVGFSLAIAGGRNTTCTCPAIKSVSAGPPPRYGTCTRLTQYFADQRSARLNFGVLSDAIHALKIPKAAVAYQREHGALWVRDEALVAHLRRASADGALRRCGAVSGRLFSASSAQPNQVGTSGDISGTGRAPLGFDSGMFRRSEATSLPSDSTWPCSLDRATVWPCACSRRRVSEIRQGGSSCVLAELLLQEMRLDGLRSPKAAPRRAK
jgi:hypothetical protein